MGGLWNFLGKVKESETLDAATHREIKEEVNLDVTIDGFLCKVKHAYSHFKITLHAYLCSTKNDNPLKCSSADEFKWVSPKELNKFAFPKANKVIIDHLIQSLHKQP